jgi:hypothetical protein
MKKNKLKLIHLLLLVGSVLQPSVSLGADTPTPSDPKIEEIGKQAPSGITLGVVDGIIRYVNNEKRLKIRLDWEPMPTTQSLINSAKDTEFTVTKFQIDNRDIKSGDWQRKISASNREKLLKALNVDSLEKLTLTEKLDVNSLSNLEAKSLKVRDYVGMQRDRNILKILLLSKGAEYSFGFKANERTLLPPEFSSQNIIWDVRVYTFGNEEQSQFHRFTAKAIVEPFEKRLTEDVIRRKDDKSNVLYDAKFKLVKSDQISSITKNIFSLPSELDLGEPNENSKKPFDTATSDRVQSSLSSLSGFFYFLGGVEQLGTAVEGLLSGTENVSITSGGLINFKSGGVSPLIGINQEVTKIGDDISGGILLGVGLGEKTSLFLGPSLRSSLFTISAGAVLGTQTNANVDFSGLLAVDLSRLSNNKKDIPPIKVKTSASGGGFGEETEEIVNTYTVVKYTSNRDTELTRVCNENLQSIASANRSLLTFKKSDKTTSKYIPRGIYKYSSTDKTKIYYANLLSEYVTSLVLSSDGKAGLKPACVVD